MNGKSEDEDERMSRDLITENLKKVYDETANEEVPDRFKDLLARLKQSDADGGGRK